MLVLQRLRHSVCPQGAFSLTTWRNMGMEGSAMWPLHLMLTTEACSKQNRTIDSLHCSFHEEGTWHSSADPWMLDSFGPCLSVPVLQWGAAALQVTADPETVSALLLPSAQGRCSGSLQRWLTTVQSHPSAHSAVSEALPHAPDSRDTLQGRPGGQLNPRH